jgi:hypothetical protein
MPAPGGLHPSLAAGSWTDLTNFTYTGPALASAKVN